jgi:hypothetical protein
MNSGQNAMAAQSFDAWFTTYPVTHKCAGQTVEVVTREWAESAIKYALDGWTPNSARAASDEKDGG